MSIFATSILRNTQMWMIVFNYYISSFNSLNWETWTCWAFNVCLAP